MMGRPQSSSLVSKNTLICILMLSMMATIRDEQEMALSEKILRFLSSQISLTRFLMSC
ncbi:hypothetical protein K2173_020324 [Erythroxylum novogranatense]|uniref:Uncharacterized protein n=1 Tax=Erythroxylum novogranatense TaxID=1862640 RepID=A0AAV8UBH4_9ROSI|nr:hypothetical protein K2173_020324 [Erythroxylum novogranatense]